MRDSDNVISIEANAQYILNQNVDLMTDADISRATIYQQPKKSKQNTYSPLLTADTQQRAYWNSFGDEDILLNPNIHCSTMSIGGQATSPEVEDVDDIDDMDMMDNFTPLPDGIYI